MPRSLGEGLGLFLLPFAVYAGFLVLRSRVPFPAGWTSAWFVRLSAAGLVLAILGLLALGLFSGQSRGVYVPAHLDHGRLVPGHLS